MKTGDCRDPMTRENYSDKDLLRLDLEAKKFKFKFCSVYKIKKNLNYARKIKNRENEILSFEMRMDELKELIYYIINSEMYLWNLEAEPILIENIEYQNIDSFIKSVLNELKMVIINLRLHDSYSADLFKKNFISELNEMGDFTFLINLI